MTVKTSPGSRLRLTKRFLADRRAATAIEYSIVAAGIAVTIAATVWSLGTAIQTTLYNKLAQLF